jgi:hypothetical protein
MMVIGRDRWHFSALAPATGIWRRISRRSAEGETTALRKAHCQKQTTESRDAVDS